MMEEDIQFIGYVRYVHKGTPNQAAANMAAYVCHRCGAFVYDKGKHLEFHTAEDARLGGVAAVAMEAERWAGMMRPLG